MKERPFNRASDFGLAEGRDFLHQSFDELSDVIKNAPSPTKAPKSHLAAANTEFAHSNIVIPSRATLNVQTKSPNIKQITITENGDDILDDFLPHFQDTTKISLNTMTKSLVRCSLPANLTPENETFDQLCVREFNDKVTWSWTVDDRQPGVSEAGLGAERAGNRKGRRTSVNAGTGVFTQLYVARNRRHAGDHVHGKVHRRGKVLSLRR